MKISLNEFIGTITVESNGKTILRRTSVPLTELKQQLSEWLSKVSVERPSTFCFQSTKKEQLGIFRIEPRPTNWQFTNAKEIIRSPELLTLQEWKRILLESGLSKGV